MRSWTNRVVVEAKPRVAPIQWLGGKSKHTLRIHEHLQFIGRDCEVYVEPYAGSLSVFWTLPRPYPKEIVSDADFHLMTMYTVIRDEEWFPRLWARVMRTLYSVAAIEDANAVLERRPPASPIDIAWAMLLLYNSGFGGQRPTTRGTWGRTFKPSYGIANTVNTRLGKMRALPACHYRLQTAQLHCADALDIIPAYDSPHTVFYLDPPYHPDTRKSGEYTCEVDAEHHTRLLECLLHIKGKAVLSGYPHEDYQALETAGWKRFVYPTSCHAAVRARGSRLRGTGAATAHAPRYECIWVSPS